MCRSQVKFFEVVRFRQASDSAGRLLSIHVTITTSATIDVPRRLANFRPLLLLLATTTILLSHMDVVSGRILILNET